MPVQQVTGGLSQRQDRSYFLFAGVDTEGGIEIIETYDYPARGQYQGREYAYRLTIPAAYATVFLARLAREAQPHPSPLQRLGALFSHNGSGGRRRGHSKPQQQALVTLFKQLVKRGVLASAETASAKQNLETLIAWLDQEQIPYAVSPWSF
jgi:hypothetical protein